MNTVHTIGQHFWYCLGRAIKQDLGRWVRCSIDGRGARDHLEVLHHLGPGAGRIRVEALAPELPLVLDAVPHKGDQAAEGGGVLGLEIGDISAVDDGVDGGELGGSQGGAVGDGGDGLLDAGVAARRLGLGGEAGEGDKGGDDCHEK